MNFEEALKAELSVGELANKVYPLNAPEGTRPPYLVYLSSDGMPEKTLEGYQDLKEVSGELNIIQAKYSSLKALIPIVTAKLRSFIGRSIGDGGPFIQNVTYEEPVELWEEAVKQWRCNIRFTVNF